MNPYTKRILATLGDRQPLAVLEETPKRLEQLMRGIGTEGLQRSYAPGKWTAAQILCHLADVELAVGFRLRQALAEEKHTIQVFDQDAWAKRYPGSDAQLATAAQRALRAWNLWLIKHLKPEDLRQVAFHPERGDESVERIIQMLAGHDLNHLAQLETIRGTLQAKSA